MRGLALAGMVAVSFGLLGYYATDEFGAFSMINLGLGAAALVLAAFQGLRGVRVAGSPAARRVLLARVGAVLGALLLGIGIERALAAATDPLDWTLDQSFELAPATREALATLPGPLRIGLFYERHDPRTRRIGLLLDRMAEAGNAQVRRRVMDESLDEVQRFDLAYSNSVVFELGDRFTVVERPTEGTLLEGLHQLTLERTLPLYVARGSGEGNLASIEEGGYSGLAAALQNEGYALRDLVTAAMTEVPEDAAALLLLAPQRGLRDAAYAAIDRYLEEGGRVLLLAEPQSPEDLVSFAGRWGFELTAGAVVDPASGPLEGAPPGVNPIVYAYSEHPVTRGLDGDTMTFFLRARPAAPVRKPRPEDRLSALAYTSPRSWLTANVEAVRRGILPPRPDDAPSHRYPLVSAGSYPRGENEARMVVIGDAEFASNRYLRSLYNLDLLLNAVHWLTEQESRITLRPKAVTQDQDPLTPQQTLSMLYGVGLLLPELMLIAGGVVWLRRRGA